MRCLLWNYLNFFLFKISCGIGFDKLVMCEATTALPPLQPKLLFVLVYHGFGITR